MNNEEEPLVEILSLSLDEPPTSSTFEADPPPQQHQPTNGGRGKRTDDNNQSPPNNNHDTSKTVAASSTRSAEEDDTASEEENTFISRPVASSDNGLVAVTSGVDGSPCSDGDEGETTTIINEWDSTAAQEEVEGVALLRQIFPDESTEELKRIHRERLKKKTKDEEKSGSASEVLVESSAESSSKNNNNHSYRTSSLRSKLGRRLLGETISTCPDGGNINDSNHLPPEETILPHDFLRLPPHVAVRRYDEETGKWRYHSVQDMADRAWEKHYLALVSFRQNPSCYAAPLLLSEEEEGRLAYYTRSIYRDPNVGLGLSLYEQRGIVRVHSLTLRDGTTLKDQQRPPLLSPNNNNNNNNNNGSPALQAGVRPGDILVGLNGTALFESMTDDEIAANQHCLLLKRAVSYIHNSPAEPIVLHFQREVTAAVAESGMLLVDNNNDGPYGVSTGASLFMVTPTKPSVVTLPIVDPATTPSLLDTSDFLNESQLSANGEPSPLLHHHDDHHHLLTERSYHSTPMIEDANSKKLIHPFVATLRSHGILQSFEDERFCTLMLQQFTERTRQWEASACFRFVDEDYGQDEVFVPLMNVRKALSLRIVNSFTDGNELAFTIWVYDVETGNEWYAPVRYFRDFQDLRNALARLIPSVVAQLPFPKQPLSFFGSPARRDSPNERENKSRMLEHFLRTSCTLLYRDVLHPAVAEIAIHIQSFLGCENVPLINNITGLLSDGGPMMYSLEGGSGSDDKNIQHAMRVRHILKRNLQLYTYRLFLLDRVSAVVNTFVNSFRGKGPRLEDLEALEAQGRSVLKARAMSDLEQMKTFLDKMQDLIIEGCRQDFLSIAERDEYETIHDMIHGKKGKGGESTFWDRLVRESVREQVEMEVYVPLRSIVSRWIVQGWRHEDMEVQFKIKELRKRPQGPLSRVPSRQEPSQWSSVSKILKEGVGMSTLPCAKLRAIVESAREITRLFKAGVAGEGPGGEDTNGLGADDFLPIFIYCVVQAEMERPCALCVLLRALCDPINRLGEIGYYLASFEAAITHIQEVDLTDEEEGEDMQSFLSVPLDS